MLFRSWSGEAVKILDREFEAMGLEIVTPGLAIKYVPDASALARSFEMGETIGQKINAAFA